MPLSDEAWERIRSKAVSRESATAPADTDVSPVAERVPPPPSLPSSPGVAERLLSAVDPEMQAILATNLDRQTKTGRAIADSIVEPLNAARSAKSRAALEDPNTFVGPPPVTQQLTVGDVMDLDPDELRNIGWTDSADLVEKVRKLAPGDEKSTVYGAEFGQQKADALRSLPMQRMTGQFEASPAKYEQRIGELLAMKEFRRRGTNYYKASPELRQAVIADAKDKARREVASVVGRDDQRQNMLMDVRDSDEILQEARRGQGGMWPLYLTPMVGGTVAGAMAREKLGGPAVEDQWNVNFWSPFIATTKIGQKSYGVEEGKPVLGAQKEGKLSWIFRMAPSTAIASWFLDPEATWEMGGENGWGGDRHLAKVLGGYDIVQDVPRVGEMYDAVTPWESSHLEKLAAAAIPLGAVILAEPDAISIGTALAGAPVAKLAKEAKLGKVAVKYAIKPALEEMRAALEAGGGLAELEAVVGSKGSLRRILYDAIAGDTIQRILAEAAEAGELLGPTKVKQLRELERAESELGDIALRHSDRTNQLASQLGNQQIDAADRAAELTDKIGKRQQQAADATSKVVGDISDRQIAQSARAGELQDAADAARKTAADEASGAIDDLDALESETVKLIDALRQSETALVEAAAFKAVPEELKEGSKLLDPATNKILTVTGISGDLVEGGGTKMRRLRVADEAGASKWIRPNQAQKMLDDRIALDAATKSPTLQQLLAAKKRYAELREMKQVAAEAGHAAEVASITAEMGKIYKEVVQIGNRSAFKAAQETYNAANKAFNAHLRKLQRARTYARIGGKGGAKNLEAIAEAEARINKQAAKSAARAQKDAGRLAGVVQAGAEGVTKAQDRLAGHTDKYAERVKGMLDAMVESRSKEQVAKRQQEAFAKAKQHLDHTIKQYELAFDAYLRSADAGKLAAGEMVGGVLADTVVRSGGDITLDGSRYLGNLVRQYGSEAVDQVLGSNAGQAINALAGKSAKLTPEQYQALRSVEERIFRLADVERMGEFSQASNVLDKLGKFKLMPGNSIEAWAAKSYQLAKMLDRATDWVGGTSIGRSPRVIREVVRRSFQRFHGAQREMAHINKSFGQDGMREFIISHRQFDGAISNQDVQTHADKALAYLRGLHYAKKAAEEAGEKGATAWSQDLVVSALTASPLPSFSTAVVAPGEAAAAIEQLLVKPDLTGAQFVAELERILPAIYYKQLGSTDSEAVTLGFIYRALLQGSNLHDTMYDLERATGPGIDAATARAWNWFIQPEKKLAEAVDIESAQRAAQAYGLPALSHHAGEIQYLGKAKATQNRLVNVARTAGHDHYVPEAMFAALQQVPRRLAKELAEFNEDTTFVGRQYDTLTRLWRVSTVNGWILPRAAHFVNTAAGDWSQMVTTLGWREATSLTAQNVVAYVPFFGPRLQNRLLARADNSSLLRNFLDPTLGVVLRAGDEVVETAEGPMSARRFLQEAFEDGVYDSVSTSDIAAMTSRHQRGLFNKGIPAHIEATAQFMEELQYRQRLALYLRKRANGMSRQQARDTMVEALYDFSTGVPSWEHKFIGRLSAFWSYRRGMMRQLGAAATEGISDPSAQYWAKAMTGRTKLARMRQTGKIISGIPDAIYWQDPNEYLDDDEQLSLYGKQTAPWWAAAKGWLGNRAISPERELWYSEVAGKKVTFESFLIPSLTTLDQLNMAHMVIQTGMATSIMLAESAGLRPNVTTAGADKLWEELVDGFSDQLMPSFATVVNNALRPVLSEGKHRSDKGTPITQDQAVMLRRLGWEEFMGAEPDADGRIRVDSTALGIATQLALGFPPAADIARTWGILDNPALEEGLFPGLAEAAGRWTGLFKPYGHDPLKGGDYGVKARAAELKRAEALLKKRLEGDKR